MLLRAKNVGGNLRINRLPAPASPVRHHGKQDVVNDALKGLAGSTRAIRGGILSIIHVEVFKRATPDLSVLYGVEVLDINHDNEASLSLQITLHVLYSILYSDNHGGKPCIAIIVNHLQRIIAAESANQCFGCEITKRCITESGLVDN
jgi:hypothetical protein